MKLNQIEIYFQQNVITQVASIILMDGIILLSLISFFLELSTKKNIDDGSQIAQNDLNDDIPF